MQGQINQKQVHNYLVYNKGSTTIINNTNTLNEYQQCIKFTKGQSQFKLNQNKPSLFVDNNFAITKTDIANLQVQFKQQIILKRLCRLYPQKHTPPLFPQIQSKLILPKIASIPHCIYQIFMLESTVFKKKIINKKIAQNGKYQILVNHNGIYKLQTIDDIIPVFKKSEEPVWGTYLKEPWQIILIKIWAKINEGYSKLKDSSSFLFLQYFGETNWKIFNLRQYGIYFISYYKDKINENSKFLLKSKKSQINQDSGLASGRIAYQLTAIQQENNQNPIFIIQTIFHNSWTGKNSIVDKQLRITEKIKQKFKLNRTLILNQKDFLNIFSFAFITHAKIQTPYYKSFYQFKNLANFNKARHFYINFQKEGFFSFSIQQPVSQLQVAAQINKSNQQQKPLDSNRKRIRNYLPLKFIFSRKIDINSQIQIDQESSISKIGSLIRQSRIKFQKKYNELEYDIHQMGNLLGQGKGNASFIKVVPGSYIFRIKSQSSANSSNFVITYSTHQLTDIANISMTPAQCNSFLDDSIISLSDRLPGQTFSKQKYENLVMADYTNQIGYAFTVIKVDKKCPYTVILQTNPKVLFEQGYRLKKQFKNQKEKFKIQLKGGQSKAIIFKRRKDKKQFIWPTQAFKVTNKKNR